jgi:hypothetical protein
MRSGMRADLDNGVLFARRSGWDDPSEAFVYGELEVFGKRSCREFF